LQSKFPKALESKKSGESMKWSLPDKTLSAEIMPTATFRLDDGRYSRRYVQILNRPEGRQAYYGMAVRDAKGRWVIPRR
jgi:surface antigen